jgi:membrane protein
VFGLPHRGARDLPRLLIWIAVLCGVVAFESLVGRPARNAAGGSGLVELVTAAIFIPFFWWTMHFLLAGRVRRRVLLLSAIGTDALFAVLGLFSELYFSSTIITDSRTFGPIGAVFSLLTWLIAISFVIILGALTGAVWEQRHSADPAP